MAKVMKLQHECEHCEKSYNSRGPKCNHKFACHYGGYDCDLCPENFKFRELLNFHYRSAHNLATNPKQDFGHIKKSERDKMDEAALAAKSPQTLPTLSMVQSQSVAMPTIRRKSGPEMRELARELAPKILSDGTIDRSKIVAISSPMESEDEDSLVDINGCKSTDLIDLSVSNIASEQNTMQIIDRLIQKDLRLGVNLRAQVFLMAQRAETLFDEGQLTVDQILHHVRPAFNN